MAIHSRSSHKGPRVGELIEAAAASVHYLPPDSPDFNPIEDRGSRIEDAFAKLKPLLCKTATRAIDALSAAIGHLVDTFRPTECANYFAAEGYF